MPLLVDLHLHCRNRRMKFVERPLLPPFTAVIRRAIELNLGAIAITNHDLLDEDIVAVAENYRDKIIFIPSEEITTRDGHLLAYGIKKEIRSGLSALETINLIHEQGGAAIAAHPFWWGFSLKEKVFSLPLDGLEVFNASISRGQNEKSLAAAKKMKLATTGGSDAHFSSFVGYGLSVFDEGIKNYEEIIAAIRNRAVGYQGKSYTKIEELRAFFRERIISK